MHLSKNHLAPLLAGLSIGLPLKSKHIVFDLGNVLVKTDKLAFARYVGLSSFLSYIVIDFQHPKNIESVIFNVLDHLGLQKNVSGLLATNDTTILPEIMCQWLSGNISSEEIIQCVQNKIEELDQKNFFISSREKNLAEQVLTKMFDPEILACTTFIIPQALELLKKLRLKFGNNHTFYILSNWDHDSFNFLQNHPNMLALFDFFLPENIFISGNHHSIKPHTTFYEAFLNAYQLNPRDCIFIDDQENNIIGAQLAGIPSIQLINNDYERLEEMLLSALEEPSTVSYRALPKMQQ